MSQNSHGPTQQRTRYVFAYCCKPQRPKIIPERGGYLPNPVLSKTMTQP